MTDKAREVFYNIRNQLDKRRHVAEHVGDLACVPYFSLMPDVRGKVLLDAGIGSGWLTRALALRKPRLIYAVDISSERVEEFRTWSAEESKNLRDVQFECKWGSVENLSHIASASVDFINCRDVIEHLPHPEIRLAEFMRVLKRGGLVLVETPNNFIHSDANLAHRFSEMLTELRLGKPAAIVEDPFLEQGSRALKEEEREKLEAIAAENIKEHEFMWRPVELKEFMERAGFACDALSGTPLWSAVWHQQGLELPSLCFMYLEFAKSPVFKKMLEALRDDLMLLGRIDEQMASLPLEYFLSDDLIVLARKP